jgi:hypothetical protein
MKSNTIRFKLQLFLTRFEFFENRAIIMKEFIAF